MSDKSKPSDISKWWKQIVGTNASNTRVCEKGHPMDPNWKTCAYCDAETRAHQKTAHKADEIESGKSMQRSITMERRTTQVDNGESGEGRGATKFETSSVSPQREKPDTRLQMEKSDAGQRKLTGVLVTFNWRPQGKLFPLYEGRNVIGSASEELCDIYISNRTDEMVSKEHAVILCRAGRDELHDMLSTNGTFLNEKYVERDGADLIDGALIKTGATVFEFRKFTSGGDRAPEGDRARYDEGGGDTQKPRSSGETEI